MLKPKFAFVALYIMLSIYGITLSWFLYIGPYTTYKVATAIAQAQQRIVVSLTTTPYRIDKLQATLDSLSKQSIRPSKIYVNIPYNFKRENIAYNIPGWLQEYPNIVINRCLDYGPITKLLPTLDLETDAHSIIITVDDDVLYPRQMVRDLVAFAMQNQDVTVTPININYALTADFNFTNIEYKFKQGSNVALAVGAAGIAYRRGFFAADFHSYVQQLPPQCFLADDLVISMYLAANRINIMQTTAKSFNPWLVPLTYTELPFKNAPDALSFSEGPLSGNQIRYAQCLQSMQGTPLRRFALAFIAKQ